MRSIEKISVALPPEMVAAVKGAVEAGEYSSNSEVIRDALRDWTLKRSVQQHALEDLRRVWQEARHDQRPGVPVDDVLNRLEQKYQSLATRLRPHR
jgi:antitoxin ParD1/3/4